MYIYIDRERENGRPVLRGAWKKKLGNTPPLLSFPFLLYLFISFFFSLPIPEEEARFLFFLFEKEEIRLKRNWRDGDREI